ncbi:MAG: hypothetical protein H0T82_09525 [Sphingomonas sp.]|jgi:hypothetical protein|nr:hypothetical protein [Sphingomonas sp.]
MRKPVHNETLWCRVNTVLATKARERAAGEGASPSEYLRDLIRRDVRVDA